MPQSQTLRIVLDAPQAALAAHRAPQYLSAATLSLTANITPQGSTTSISGYPQTVNLTPTSNGCSSTLASTQCALSLSVPVGMFDVTITTYDGTDGSGAILSAAESIPVTIQAGVANNLGITLGGVAASTRIVSDSPAIGGNAAGGFVLPSGAAAVSVFGVDADGNYILGVGAPTVALTSSNASFTISTSAAAPNRFTITNANAASSAVATLTATITPAAQSGVAPIVQTARLYAQTPVSVTRFDDTAAGSPPGSGTGMPGDLRYEMLNAPSGSIIQFSGCSACIVTLQGPLPPIARDLSIDGTGDTDEATIDGASAYRAFFVESGTVALRNLHVQNVAAIGGPGGAGVTFDGVVYQVLYTSYSGNGGGGAGLGGGLFIDQPGAAVSVTNVTFTGCRAIGGSGAQGQAENTSSRFGGGGGGGGIGGNGAAASTDGANAGGGGGVLGSASGEYGGYGDGAGADGQRAGTAYTNGDGASGLTGGFGGGGAGGNSLNTTSNGGSGGFGGGGGGAYSVINGSSAAGAGGPGGGGGGGGFFTDGYPYDTYAYAGGGGGSLGTVSGGNGGLDGGGGGGAAAGPAIFVNAGTLTISGTAATMMTATAGLAGSVAAGRPGASTAGSADATPVYNFAGSVNGSTAQGPVMTAIASFAPRTLKLPSVWHKKS